MTAPARTVQRSYVTAYQTHREKWKDCKDCVLCETRKNVVLFRGSIPAEILFIGESPGISENELNAPFVGEAGKLLDRIIEEAFNSSREASYAITNVVACIPLDEDEKIRQPAKAEILECSTRLEEFHNLVKPKIVVAIGAIAKRFVPIVFRNYGDEFSWIHITHPSAILHNEGTPKADLEYKRAVLNLSQAIDRLK